MPRILIVLACATVLVFGWMFINIQSNKKEAAQLWTYEAVLLERQ